MDENVSKTLYEKLEEIETIKNNLRDSLYQIGGNDYFQVEPKFEDYPNLIVNIFGTIQFICLYFENYVFGKNIEEGLKQSELTYHTLTKYILELDQCKTKLVNILNTYGVYVERDTPFMDIINKVTEIPGACIPYKPTYISFRDFRDEDLSDSLEGLDTSNITDMNSMFYNCSNVTELDLSNFNTDKVTSMATMFWGCGSIESLDISSFNMSNVTNVNNMFASCNNLTHIDFGDTTLESVTEMQYMFSYTNKLDDETLNNILALLTTVSSTTANRKLSYLGFNSTIQEKCTTLDNYDMFIESGWTLN